MWQPVHVRYSVPYPSHWSWSQYYDRVERLPVFLMLITYIYFLNNYWWQKSCFSLKLLVFFIPTVFWEIIYKEKVALLSLIWNTNNLIISATTTGGLLVFHLQAPICTINNITTNYKSEFSHKITLMSQKDWSKWPNAAMLFLFCLKLNIKNWLVAEHSDNLRLYFVWYDIVWIIYNYI